MDVFLVSSVQFPMLSTIELEVKQYQATVDICFLRTLKVYSLVRTLFFPLKCDTHCHIITMCEINAIKNCILKLYQIPLRTQD